MSLIDTIINQTKIDAALLCESSDISYKSAVETAQQSHSKSGIIHPPKDEITKEMIIDTKKNSKILNQLYRWKWRRNEILS